MPVSTRRALAGLLLVVPLAALPLHAQEPKTKKRGGLAGFLDRMNDLSVDNAMANATAIDLSRRGLPAIAFDSLRFAVVESKVTDSSGVRVTGVLHNLTDHLVELPTRVVDSVALIGADGKRLARQGHLLVEGGVHTAPSVRVPARGIRRIAFTYASPAPGVTTGILRFATRGAIMPIPVRPDAPPTTAAKPSVAEGTTSGAAPSAAAGYASGAAAAPAPAAPPPPAGTKAEANYRALQGSWEYTRFWTLKPGGDEVGAMDVASGTLVVGADMAVTQAFTLGGRTTRQQGKAHFSGDVAYVTWASGETERWRLKFSGATVQVTSGEDGGARTVAVLRRAP